MSDVEPIKRLEFQLFGCSYGGTLMLSIFWTELVGGDHIQLAQGFSLHLTTPRLLFIQPEKLSIDVVRNKVSAHKYGAMEDLGAISRKHRNQPHMH